MYKEWNFTEISQEITAQIVWPVSHWEWMSRDQKWKFLEILFPTFVSCLICWTRSNSVSFQRIFGEFSPNHLSIFSEPLYIHNFCCKIYQILKNIGCRGSNRRSWHMTANNVLSISENQNITTLVWGTGFSSCKNYLIDSGIFPEISRKIFGNIILIYF